MSQVTNERKYELFAKYITTPANRSRLAATLVSPLRRRRDYSSVIRKAFLVETLLDGVVPLYDKDPNVTAYVVSEEGENIVAVAKPKRVHIPLFEIAANPEISIAEARARRFDLVQRSIDLAIAEVGAEEDRKGFATIDALCTDPTTPNPDLAITGNLTANSLADAFANIERTDVRVAYVFLNAKDFSDLRKWDRDTLDVETQASLLRTGLMGTLWGAKIVTSRIVPEGTVYVTGEPEFFGRIPVRQELTVISADRPSARMIGFSIFENIGIGAYNPYAAQRCVITRV